jgi:thiol-disulfide isomerase/thioredoxin
MSLAKTHIIASILFFSIYSFTREGKKDIKIDTSDKKKELKQDSLTNKNLYSILNLQEKQIDSLKGKTQFFYVDFWASWCTACIGHFRFSKRIQEDYKSAPIAFIFVSIDEDEMFWKSAKEKYKISALNSYRISNYQENSFIKVYNIFSLPRYMIFDNRGNVINSQAPNPSNPEIREIFEKLLNK